MKKMFVVALFICLLPAAALAESGSPSGKVLADSCISLLRSGWLWKPASQDSGGLREGKPMILITKNRPSSKGSLKVFSANGAKICTMKKWSSERYYLGTGCKKTASQLRTLAQQSAGSSAVYVEGPGTKCYGPIPNPTSRNDKR